MENVMVRDMVTMTSEFDWRSDSTRERSSVEVSEFNNVYTRSVADSVNVTNSIGNM